MPGIMRSRINKNGSIKYYYRYPVTNLLSGQYCPLCLKEIPEGRQEIHHIVPKQKTLHDIGKVINHHRNLIHICAVCHKKITHGDDQERVILIYRIEYYMSAIYGLAYYSSRNILKKLLTNAKSFISELDDDKRTKDVMSIIRTANEYVKKTGVAHYRASFEERNYKNRDIEEFYYLNEFEIFYQYGQTPHFVWDFE